jgi:hypothetical protein
MTDPYLKDPSSRLDYQIDWSTWLDTDTISASTWTVPTGLTLYSQSNTATAAIVWLEGGTAGEEYMVTNQITTAGGRVDQRSFKVVVRER